MENSDKIPVDDSSISLDDFISYYQAYKKLQAIYEKQHEILKKFYGNI